MVRLDHDDVDPRERVRERGRARALDRSTRSMSGAVKKDRLQSHGRNENPPAPAHREGRKNFRPRNRESENGSGFKNLPGRTMGKRRSGPRAQLQALAKTWIFGKRRQTVHDCSRVISVLVGQKNRVDFFHRLRRSTDSSWLSPSHGKPCIDQNARGFGLQECAVSCAAAAENTKPHPHFIR